MIGAERAGGRAILSAFSRAAAAGPLQHSRAAAAAKLMRPKRQTSGRGQLASFAGQTLLLLQAGRPNGRPAASPICNAKQTRAGLQIGWAPRLISCTGGGCKRAAGRASEFVVILLGGELTLFARALSLSRPMQLWPGQNLHFRRPQARATLPLSWPAAQLFVLPFVCARPRQRPTHIYGNSAELWGQKFGLSASETICTEQGRAPSHCGLAGRPGGRHFGPQ